MDNFNSDYFTKQTSASFVSLESLLLKPTKKITNKYDLLTLQQLTSFSAQMKYDAYNRKTEQFSKRSFGRHSQKAKVNLKVEKDY